MQCCQRTKGTCLGVSELWRPENFPSKVVLSGERLFEAIALSCFCVCVCDENNPLTSSETYEARTWTRDADTAQT